MKFYGLLLPLAILSFPSVVMASHFGLFFQNWHKNPRDACATTNPTVGAVCSDGTVYAGMIGSQKYAVPPTDDVPSTTFYASEYTNTGATSNSDGQYNTNILKARGNFASTYNAAYACGSSTRYGHNDWFLPAIDQLTLMFNNRYLIGNFNLSNYAPSTYENMSRYHSSTETRYDADYSINFATGGYLSLTNKYVYAPSLVRCMRAIP
jgi:hypothetical protein